MSIIILWLDYTQLDRFIHTKQFIPRKPSPSLPLCTYQLKTLSDKENVSVYFNRKAAH